MDTKFPVGGLVISQIGYTKNDVLFWRVSERTGNKLRLTRLLPSTTVKGNPIPGDPDPHSKPISRKVIQMYGAEFLAPVIIGGYAAGLAPWGNPVKRMGRGGKRIGAGRKKGTGKGRASVSKSITLTTEEWALIQQLSGSTGISEFFRRAIFTPERNFEKNEKTC